MPVKFLTITQQGYDFLVHDADKSVKDETWSIERVAAYMSVHYTLNVKARKYAKGMTFIPTVAATQYTFQADAVTSADIDKLTAFLVPKLCGIYEDPFKQGFLGRPLPQVLDDVEKMALDHIEQEEAEIEVFGQKCKPKPFYSRPSRRSTTQQLLNPELLKKPCGTTTTRCSTAERPKAIQSASRKARTCTQVPLSERPKNASTVM